MHFLSSRGLKIWVGIALLKKKEMYFLEKAAVGKKAVEKAGKGLRCRILRLHRGCSFPRKMWRNLVTAWS